MYRALLLAAVLMLATLISSTYSAAPPARSNAAGKGDDAIGSGDDGKLPDAIARSGGAAVEEITILRHKGVASGKVVDVTKMEVTLWFPAKWRAEAEGYLVKLLDLSTVEDDSGKVLTTKDRLEDIDRLKVVTLNSWRRGTQRLGGPFVKIVLDAPARSAHALKTMRGRMQVSRPTLTRLRFDDTATLAGKPLTHAKLKGFQIKPTVEVKNGRTLLKLWVPADYTRIVDFGLGDEDGLYEEFSEGVTSGQDVVILSKTYDEELPKSSSLHITVAEAAETQVFDFNFKNLPLP